MDTQLLQFLQENSIDYDLYEHPPVMTVEESNRLDIDLPGVHTKNLFLKNKKNDYFFVSLAATKQLDLKSFAQQYGTGRLSFGSAERLQEELCVQPGSVGIFGLYYAKNINVFIDQDIRHADAAGWHPNHNAATLVLHQKMFRRYFDIINIGPVVVGIV